MILVLVSSDIFGLCWSSGLFHLWLVHCQHKIVFLDADWRDKFNHFLASSGRYCMLSCLYLYFVFVFVSSLLCISSLYPLLVWYLLKYKLDVFRLNFHLLDRKRNWCAAATANHSSFISFSLLFGADTRLQPPLQVFTIYFRSKITLDNWSTKKLEILFGDDVKDGISQ